MKYESYDDKNKTVFYNFDNLSDTIYGSGYLKIYTTTLNIFLSKIITNSIFDLTLPTDLSLTKLKINITNTNKDFYNQLINEIIITKKKK